MQVFQSHCDDNFYSGFEQRRSDLTTPLCCNLIFCAENRVKCRDKKGGQVSGCNNPRSQCSGVDGSSRRGSGQLQRTVCNQQCLLMDWTGYKRNGAVRSGTTYNSFWSNWQIELSFTEMEEISLDHENQELDCYVIICKLPLKDVSRGFE